MTPRVDYNKTHVGAQFQLFGFEALQDKFAKLPDKIERKIAKEALTAALQPVLHTARALCPVSDETSSSDANPQHLVSTLKITRWRSRNYRYSLLVTAGMTEDIPGIEPEDVGHLYKGNFYYAGMVEWGHRIGARKGNKYRDKLGRVVDTRKAVAPRPFMRPALDQNREQVGMIMAQKLAEGVKVEFAKT